MTQKKNMAKAIAAGLAAIAMQPALPALAAGAQWEYAVKHNAQDDAGSVYARLRGEGPSYLWLSCIRTPSDGEGAPILLVAATVAQKEFLGASNGKGRSTVYWFDEGTPEVAPWVYRNQYGQLIGKDQVEAFLENLSSSRKLDVELSNYRFEPVKLSFMLNPAETKAIAERFSRDCQELRRERL
jgi:hypothetical protein